MSFTLEADAPKPLYRQLMDDLRAKIETGELPVGAGIPSEIELCQEYNVSRITVRKALEELAEEGLLTRKQGKGTFVSSPYVGHSNLKQINSFHEACRMLGKKPSSRVIHAGYEAAAARDKRELQLSGGGNVVVTTRVRMADRIPVVLEINRFSSAYSYLLESDLSGSLYNTLRIYGIEALTASHDVSLCFAGEEQSALLQVNIGDPLIMLHEVVYDQNGRPIHSSDQYIRGDIFTLRI